MKYRDHIVKLNCDSRAFPFLDMGTEGFKKCLGIIPFNVGLCPCNILMYVYINISMVYRNSCISNIEHIINYLFNVRIYGCWYTA